jgi:hypothetical protein
MKNSFQPGGGLLILAMLFCWSSTISAFVLVEASRPPLQVSHPSSIARSNKKTIIRHLTILKYPVELSFKLKGEPLKSIETVIPEQGIRTNEFDANVDWLKDFDISVKNISAKTITYIQVNLVLPELLWHGRTAAHQIHLGVDPDRKFLRPELRLAPNESLEIPLASQYKELAILARRGEEGPRIADVSKLEVELHAALFDDDTLFQTGEMFRRNPDPNDWQRWIRIKER